MATYAIGIDPDRVPDADKFDGMRQYNNRKRPGEANWHRMFLPPRHFHISVINTRFQ